MVAAPAARCMCECRMLFTLAFATSTKSRDNNMYFVRLENAFTSLLRFRCFWPFSLLTFYALVRMRAYSGSICWCSLFFVCKSHRPRVRKIPHCCGCVNSQLSIVRKSTDRHRKCPRISVRFGCVLFFFYLLRCRPFRPCIFHRGN